VRFLLLLVLLFGCRTADVGAPWTDPTSSVTWLPSAPGEVLPFDKAARHCDSVKAGGHDDWRLPTVDEIRSLIRDCPGTVSGGACTVTDACAGGDCFGDACFGCEFIKGRARGCYWPDALGKECDWVWSGTQVTGRPGFAWFVDFPYGFVLPISRDYEMSPWCVRR
jgi:hypothetical protein